MCLYLKKAALLLVFGCLVTLSAVAQSNILTNDTSVCSGSAVLLQSAFINGGFSTANMDSIDDKYSPPINIGFTFNFYNNPYTQCLLSSNGYITFDLSGANGYSPWPISNAIPSASNPINSIFGAWQDIDPGVAPNGQRSYITIGTAPNRKFVYSMNGIPMFSCNTLCSTSQIILFEGSNDIEVHIGTKPLCSTWNSGAAIVGVQDITGANAAFPAGYNYPTQWTANNIAWRFTWSAGSSNYNVTSIPYAPVPVNVSGSWFANGSFLSNNATVLVNPTVTTQYILSTNQCGTPSGDTITVTVTNITLNNTIKNYDCLAGTPGYIAASITAQNWPVTLNWYGIYGNSLYTVNFNSGGLTKDTLKGLLPDSFYVTLADPFGCHLEDTFAITASNYPAFTYAAVNATCATGTDGKAIIQATNTTPNYKYIWEDHLHQQLKLDFSHFNDTLSGVTPGKYYIGSSTSSICFSYDSISIGFNPFQAGLTVGPLTKCALAPVSFYGTSIGNILTSTFDFGDGQILTADTTQHIYSQVNTYTAGFIIIGNGGCVDTAYQPVTILPNIKAAVSNTPDILCKYEPFTFTDLSNGHPTQWLWTFGDGSSDTVPSTVQHAYSSYGDFIVHLRVIDSLCGSDSVALMVNVAAPPSVDLGNDINTCDGTLLNLNVITTGDKFLWSTGERTPSIKFAVNEESLVWCEVRNSANCPTRDTILLHPYQCLVFMPNAFSPNNDGVDDLLRPIAEHIDHYNLHVFNRWGAEVYAYAGADITRGWDGVYHTVAQPVGVYMYVLNATLLNGEEVHLKGDVTLMR